MSQDLTPVHLLTPEAALAELELLEDNPPPHSSDRPAWQERKDQLRTWVLMHSAPAPASLIPPPPPQELPVSMPSFPESPLEQLNILLAKLDVATDEARHAPDRQAFTKARGRVYLHRSAIKGLVALHGLEEPVLPEIPENPFVGHSAGPATEDVLEEGPEEEFLPLSDLATQHGEALQGLGELIRQYPGEIGPGLGMQVGYLLDILGTSLIQAGAA